MKYIPYFLMGLVVAVVAGSTYVYYNKEVSFGSGAGGSIWFFSGGNPTLVTTVTDGCAEWSSNSLTSTGVTCASGGGGTSVGWATSSDNNLLYNTEGNQILLSKNQTATNSSAFLEIWGDVQADYFTASSTSGTSTLPFLSVQSAMNLFGTFGTALSDFCVAITGGAGLCDGTDADTQLTQEQVEDFAGAMVTGNTETLITVTYQDADGTIDYVVDNDLANYSNTNSAFLTTVDISANTNLTVGATGIELANDDIALTSGYSIPLTASTTEWNSFYQTPSTRITAGDALTWTSNTLDVNDVTAPMLASADFGDFTCNGTTCSLDATYLTGNETITLSGDVTGSGATAITTTIGNDKVTEAMLKAVDAASDEECLTYETTTGDFEWQSCGSGGTGIATTTDIIGGDGTLETVGYFENDFIVGGTSSTSAEFQFDPEYAQFIISSSTAATSTITDNSGNKAIRLLESLGEGIEFDFATAGDVIIRGLSSVAEIVTDLNVTLTGIVNLTGATVNFGAGAIDAITEIASGLKSGADTTLITGTAGTNGNLAQWNADGDAVDSTIAASGVRTDIPQKSFSVASTTPGSTSISFDSGTTTRCFWNPDGATTISEIYAKVTKGSGTAIARIGDGTNWDAVTANTTGASNASLSNGSYTDRENMCMEIGTADSTVSEVVVTFSF